MDETTGLYILLTLEIASR